MYIFRASEREMFSLICHCPCQQICFCFNSIIGQDIDIEMCNQWSICTLSVSYSDIHLTAMAMHEVYEMCNVHDGACLSLVCLSVCLSLSISLYMFLYVRLYLCVCSCDQLRCMCTLVIKKYDAFVQITASHTLIHSYSRGHPNISHQEIDCIFKLGYWVLVSHWFAPGFDLTHRISSSSQRIVFLSCSRYTRFGVFDQNI